MKLYQIILEVPDDFDPEKMTLSASCDQEINLSSEGFIGPHTIPVIPDEVVEREVGKQLAESLILCKPSGFPSEAKAPEVDSSNEIFSIEDVTNCKEETV